MEGRQERSRVASQRALTGRVQRGRRTGFARQDSCAHRCSESHRPGAFRTGAPISHRRASLRRRVGRPKCT
ncbi:MAG TPA: hypothetical protein D7I08_06200 [Candidatus Poseidoniales archaeon]|nr:MAG TPA: hypothetical protein D7I08_06200 [Candidatus Poseidoniales archaeon]